MAESNTHKTWVTALLYLVLAACLGACAAQPGAPAAQILLLGEVHDNPHGHQKRFAELQKRVEVGGRPDPCLAFANYITRRTHHV